MWDQSRIDRGLYWDEGINLVLGCTPFAIDCDNCWAARYAHRMAGHPNAKIQAKYKGLTDVCGRWRGRAWIDYDALARLVRGRKPKVKTIWTDLFHQDIAITDILSALNRMADAKHLFLVLSKRSLRMGQILSDYNRECVVPNIWFGVTVSRWDNINVDRLAHIKVTPVAKRFISYEPAIGPFDFRPWLKSGLFHWLIAGGETGPRARPVNPDWIRAARDACLEYGVPFFFKQWGPSALLDKRFQRLVDYQVWNQHPEI